jgi:3-deoxy-D-manno-octulosonic-acid transferase
MRLGKLPNLNLLKETKPIWIHAVSVGEVNAVRSLIEGLRREYVNRNFIISTVTKTGNTLAKSIAKDNDKVIYLPLDLSFIVKKVISSVSPSIFILTETEIWPNLIYKLEKENIPVILVNGRISNHSFKKYRIVRFLLKDILKKISVFCMQTDKDRERILYLGAPKERIFVTGNMKFDTTDYTDSKIDYTDYREKLGLKVEDQLIVAGSTHPGEEEILLEVYKILLDDFRNLRLLIAPRHIERAKDIEKIVAKYGFNSIRVSQLNQNSIPRDQKTVFILDTIGELIFFYAISDIVFVGGSLIKKGGHNILEPAFFAKPIIFGQYMFNFQDICDLFLNNKAAIMVHNKEELMQKIRELLQSPLERQNLSQRAKDLVLKNQGATERNLNLIRNFV